MKMKLWIGFFVALCVMSVNLKASYFTPEKIAKLELKIKTLEEVERALRATISDREMVLLIVSAKVAITFDLVQKQRQRRQKGTKRMPLGDISVLRLEHEYENGMDLEELRCLEARRVEDLKKLNKERDDIRREKNFLLDLLTVNRMTQ